MVFSLERSSLCDGEMENREKGSNPLRLSDALESGMKIIEGRQIRGDFFGGEVDKDGSVKLCACAAGCIAIGAYAHREGCPPSSWELLSLGKVDSWQQVHDLILRGCGADVYQPYPSRLWGPGSILTAVEYMNDVAGLSFDGILKILRSDGL